MGISATNGLVTLVIIVRAGDKRFAFADARNELDNEHPDTMGAGVEVFTRVAGCRAAWMFVPQQDGAVRVRALSGWTEGSVEPQAQWRDLAEGFELRIAMPLAGQREFELDVLINETTKERERRRGQLVLSGAEGVGEFVYLRGDRHDAERLLTFRIDP